MAINEGIASYLETLERQKSLIVQLGSSSGVKIPGLNVDSVIENLAQLNEDLQKTYEYYDSQAELEASNEEQKAEAEGTIETEEQKKARRDAKKQEAKKKREETFNKYKESLGDFVQEQISIIETSVAAVEEGTKNLPQNIASAILAFGVPTAVGAAVPNYLYNWLVLFQQIKAINVVLKDLFSRYLDMLIAADKIKFALPNPILNLLEELTLIQEEIDSAIPQRPNQPE
jgi:hypothetical protein